ncbi:MAG: lipocalin family protein [Melioribacteraceae bacterium]|nr:lipocalin family protein [Melioribacteraceae bacterium]
MKSFVIICFVIICFVVFIGCSSTNYPPLEVVDEVDIERYIGKWYEIARLPNRFQEDCYRATAEYDIINSETISVINSCMEESIDGEIEMAEGKAFVVEGTNNAKLKVQFFWPFKGDYWIIDLDKENYTYAVVGSPSRKYFWILARTTKLNDQVYKEIIQRAENKGFNLSTLIVEDY